MKNHGIRIIRGLLLILILSFGLARPQDTDTVMIGIRPGRTTPVFSAAFSQMGHYIVSGDASGRVRVWDAATGRQVRKFTGHTGCVRSVAFYSSDTKIISAGDDGTVRTWSLENGRELECLTGHKGPVYSVVVSQDELIFVSGGADKTIRVWLAGSSLINDTLHGHTGEVNAVGISLDSKTIISGGEDNTVRLWEWSKGKEIRCWKGHTDSVHAVTVHPNGSLFISAGSDRKLCIWSERATNPIISLPIVGGGRIYSLALNVDGRFLILGGDSHQLILSRITFENNLPTKASIISRWTGHQGPVFTVAFNPDNSILLSTSGDGTIKIWDDPLHQKLKATLAPFKDGEWAAYTPGNDYTCSPGGEQHLRFIKKSSNSPTPTFKYAAQYKRPEGLPGLPGGNSKPPTAAPPKKVEKKKGRSAPGPARVILKSSRSWAVVIGINNYSQEQNGFDPLPYAQNDAAAVKTFLVNSLGFAPERVVSIYNQQATKKNIEALLFDTLPKKVSKYDRLFIYFSGHGERRQEKTGNVSGYLIPVDGRKDALYSTCISLSRIRDFSDFITARQVLLVIDSCFSGIAGTVHRKGNLSPATKKELEAFVKSKGRQIMTAGTSDQNSFMGQQWQNHSVYTYYLLKGLEDKADLNGDGVIWARELQLYLSENVGRDTKYQQTPQLFNLDFGEGQFVFYQEKSH